MTYDELRKERKALGWTQARIAKIMGVTTRSARRWDRGDVAVPESLATLIKVYKAKQGLRQAVDRLLKDLSAKHPHALDTVGAGRVFRELLEDERNGI